MVKQKILIGVPEVSHSEIAFYEVEGLREIGYNVSTALYGNVGGKIFIGRIISVIKNALRLRRIALLEEVSIIYLNTAFNKFGVLRDLVTLIILRSSRIPVVLKTHGSVVQFLKTRNPIFKFCIKLYSKLINKISVLSSEELESYVEFGFLREKIFIAKNIVNSGKYLTDANFKSTIGISDSIALLFVARLIPAKGLIDTVKALKLIIDQGYNCVLIVVGDGPDKIIAKTMANEYGIPNNIHFIGFIPEDETKWYYANCDITVLPTYHEEGFPMSVFQSVAAGKPIVTTRTRASADYLEEDKNCVWVKPKDHEMLAKKIIYLIDRPELRLAISKNNILLAKQFSQEVVCKELDVQFNNLT